jgi:NADH-quinone oxidoreductase subunit J
MTILQIILLFTAVVTLFGAIMVVSTRKLMHAALWLILVLLGVTIMFALLETRFFAIVQLVIYIGAIAILIIFAVMLTRRSMNADEPQINRNWWLGLISTVGFFISLLIVFSTWQGFGVATRTVPEGGENMVQLGTALVDPNGFALPFEVASVVLLAALIGAIYVAADRKGKEL